MSDPSGTVCQGIYIPSNARDTTKQSLEITITNLVGVVYLYYEGIALEIALIMVVQSELLFPMGQHGSRV